MKKIFALVLSVALLCACTLTLASCGGESLEGTYSGSYFTVDSDILEVTFGKKNTVNFKLSYAGEVETASGTYAIESEEGHSHEVMTFSFTETKDHKLLPMLLGKKFTYSSKTVDKKTTITLSDHDGSLRSLVLTEVAE